MYRYKRVFLIVMDSLGIGAMPDSDKFGDFRTHCREDGFLYHTQSPAAWHGKSKSDG